MSVFRISAIVIPVLAAALCAACSVNYDNIYETEGTIPELMLDEAVFKRVKDGKATSQIQSERLEEFKDSGKVLAQNIQFETKNDDGKVNSFGKAGIMKADTKKEVYEFFNGIHIEAPERGVTIDGESLRWNGKTEQLVGERGKPLTIKKDGVTLSGHGFSASAISESFNFATSVSGNYRDDEDVESDKDAVQGDGGGEGGQ